MKQGLVLLSLLILLGIIYKLEMFTFVTGIITSIWLIIMLLNKEN